MPDRQRRSPRGRDSGAGSADAERDGTEPDDTRPLAEDTRPTTKGARSVVQGVRPPAGTRAGAAPGPARGSTPDPAPSPLPDLAPDPPPDESDAARRRRRAQFLRELNEAKALRERVKPRQARAARMRQQMRMRTFRW